MTERQARIRVAADDWNASTRRFRRIRMDAIRGVTSWDAVTEAQISEDRAYRAYTRERYDRVHMARALA